MRAMSFAILSAALVVAVPASAQSGDEQPAKPAAEKKVCKKMTITGSRMAQRVCLTREEWKQVEAMK